MGLLQKLKSLFGSDQNRQSAGPGSEPDVTVEREPAAESEHAVKGTDGADTGGSQATTSQQTQETDGQQATETVSEAGDEDDETETAETTADHDEHTDTEDTDAEDTDAEDSPSVQEIKGIGPTYADRLSEAGYGTVADLAAADAAAVAEAAQTGEGRASDWIERAQDF